MLWSLGEIHDQTEVEHHDSALARGEDVRLFHVPVELAGGVEWVRPWAS